MVIYFKLNIPQVILCGHFDFATLVTLEICLLSTSDTIFTELVKCWLIFSTIRLVNALLTFTVHQVSVVGENGGGVVGSYECHITLPGFRILSWIVLMLLGCRVCSELSEKDKYTSLSGHWNWSCSTIKDQFDAMD